MVVFIAQQKNVVLWGNQIYSGRRKKTALTGCPLTPASPRFPNNPIPPIEPLFPAGPVWPGRPLSPYRTNAATWSHSRACHFIPLNKKAPPRVSHQCKPSANMRLHCAFSQPSWWWAKENQAAAQLITKLTCLCSDGQIGPKHNATRCPRGGQQGDDCPTRRIS